MDYEDMIEDEPEPVTVSPEPELEGVAETPRQKSPWKAFIITGVLAGLIGAVGGGYGAYEGLKRFSPEPAPQTKIDLSPLEARMDNLVERVTAAEAALERAETAEIEPVDLSPLEARLEALETTPRAEIDPDALAALQAAQADGFEWPDVSELETRLTKLEQKTEMPSEVALPTDLLDRLAALESEMERVGIAEPVTEMHEAVISDLIERITSLESRPPPEPVIKRVSLLAFPKAQLIEAAEDNQTGGMIEKALSRHIRVKDANDPMTLIEGIETDLSEGRVAAAAEKFERLPDAVRTVGRAWYDSVKASL